MEVLLVLSQRQFPGPAFLQLGIVGVIVLLDTVETPVSVVLLPDSRRSPDKPSSSPPLSVWPVHVGPVGLVGDVPHSCPVVRLQSRSLRIGSRDIEVRNIVVGLSHVYFIKYCDHYYNHVKC